MSPIRQFVVYGIGGAASRLAAIFLVPLYTRALEVDDYGRLELALALHVGVVLLAGLQVESAVARDIHAARAEGRRAQMARAALSLTCIGAAAALGVIAAIAATGWAVRWLDASALWLLALMTLPTQWFGVQLVMLRFEGRALRYSALSLLDLLLTAAFSAWFMVVMQWGVTGGLAGILAAKSLCVLLAWRDTMGGERPQGSDPAGASRVNWRRRLLDYGVPALPAVLVSWAQNAGGRVFAAAALTLHDLAIATLGMKVAALFGFLVYSLRLAWEPHAMARLERHAADPLYYRRALEWYLVGMLPLLAAAIALVPWAVRALAPSSYAAAVTVAVLAVIGQYWIGVSNLAVIGIQGARKMSRMFPVFAWGAGVNLLVLFALAPVAGPDAAAAGLLAGAACSALLAAHVSDEVFTTQFGKRLLLAALAGSVAFGVVAGWVYRAIGAPTGAVTTLSWLGTVFVLAVAVTVLVATVGLGRERAREMARRARSACTMLATRTRRRGRGDQSASHHG